MKKPFIYPFSNISGTYFYDINKNQIVEVKKELYDYIILSIKSSFFDKKNALYKDIKHISNLGFLSSNRVKKIQHPLSNYVECFLENNINNIVFQISQNCNMRCNYCPYSGSGTLTRKHNNKNMSETIIEDSLKFIYSHSTKTKNFCFSFYGGEPLLEFSKIVKIVESLNKNLFNCNIEYSITTNGTILNKEIIDFFVKNNFSLTISLDGNKETHNYNRKLNANGKGSFDIVYNNLKLIKEYNYNFFKTIKINAVTCGNDEELVENITFFENDSILKELKININNVSDALLDKKYIKTDSFNNILHFKNLINLLICKDINIINRKDSILNYNFTQTSSLPKKFQHYGPCISGFEKLFITINGDFLPCESISEKSKHMYIGNIYDGFDYKKIRKLMNIGQISHEKCKNCICIRHCSICPLAIDNINELSKDYKNYICNIKKEDFIKKLNEYTILKKVGII